MTGVFPLLNLVSSAWFVAVTVAVLGLCWAFFIDMLGKPKDRGDLTRILSEANPGRFYAGAAGYLLDRVDHWLTPGNVEDTPNPRPGARWWLNFGWLIQMLAPTRDVADRTGRPPWGWPLFDAALKLALLYPIGLLLVTWAWTGGAGRVGDLPVLPAGTDWWIRAAAICALAALVLSPLIKSNPLRLVVQLVAAGLAVAFAVAGAFAGAFAVAFAVAGAAAGAVAVAVAVAGTSSTCLACVKSAGLAPRGAHTVFTVTG